MNAAKQRSARGSGTARGLQLHRFETPGGLRVTVAPRGRIPLVAVRLVLSSGAAVDPAGKEGLADFTMRLLRRGTAQRNAHDLDEAIEFVGASLGLFAGEDQVAVPLTTPAEHLPAMLGVLAELVRSPSFPDEEVRIERERSLGQFANDVDDPSLLADRALLKVAWAGHPYGHDVSGTRASVARFQREDAVRFHAAHFGPRPAHLFVVGAVDPAAVAAQVEEAFGSWSGGPGRSTEIPAPAGIGHAGKVVVVDRPEQTQSQVRVAGPAYRRGAPVQFAAQIVNVTLGAGFTSRLVREVRVKRGLSYGVGSSFDTLRAGGLFSVSSFTKVETTGQLLSVIRGEVDRMRARGPTPAEVEKAQRYLAGLFPLRTETNESLAAVLADMVLYGLGDDWLDRYRERVRAVTRAAAQEAAARYCFPEAPVTVVVGPAERLRPQLERLGPVEVLSADDVL
ncbi:MAG TPA: pitrilysin family protein [Myxococcaceae bacterium]|nr:pitrilysin family protein [Myxococcaceae bacterium]